MTSIKINLKCSDGNISGNSKIGWKSLYDNTKIIIQF